MSGGRDGVVFQFREAVEHLARGAEAVVVGGPGRIEEAIAKRPIALVDELPRVAQLRRLLDFGAKLPIVEIDDLAVAGDIDALPELFVDLVGQFHGLGMLRAGDPQGNGVGRDDQLLHHAGGRLALLGAAVRLGDLPGPRARRAPRRRSGFR